MWHNTSKHSCKIIKYQYNNTANKESAKHTLNLTATFSEYIQYTIRIQCCVSHCRVNLNEFCAPMAGGGSFRLITNLFKWVASVPFKHVHDFDIKNCEL